MKWENLKEFFVWDKVKLITFFSILCFSGIVLFFQGFFPEIFLNLMFSFYFPAAELVRFANISSLIIGWPIILLYMYFMSCVLALIYDKVELKYLFVSVFVLVFFMSGIDVIVVNQTINPIDTSCEIQADCERRTVDNRERGAGITSPQYKCVNTNWDRYKGIFNFAFADWAPLTSACVCEENACIMEENSQNYIEDSLYCNEFNITDNECELVLHRCRLQNLPQWECDIENVLENHSSFR